MGSRLSLSNFNGVVRRPHDLRETEVTHLIELLTSQILAPWEAPPLSNVAKFGVFRFIEALRSCFGARITDYQIVGFGTFQVILAAHLKAEMNFRTPKNAYFDFSKFSAFSKFLVLVDSNRSSWTRRADAVADC